MFGIEEAILSTDCDWVFLLGGLAGLLAGSIITGLMIGLHFARREQEVWEDGHMAGWDSRARRAKEFEL